MRTSAEGNNSVSETLETYQRMARFKKLSENLQNMKKNSLENKNTLCKVESYRKTGVWQREKSSQK